MKLTAKGSDRYKRYVGQKFTCTKTGNTYEVEQEDIDKAIANSGGTISGLTCPDCRGRVGFESDQREGEYLSHKSPDVSYNSQNYRD